MFLNQNDWYHICRNVQYHIVNAVKTLFRCREQKYLIRVEKIMVWVKIIM